jgi:chemotaxis response regulator CheB
LDEARDEAPPEAVVVVGASAGGVEALTRPAADLDEDLGRDAETV